MPTELASRMSVTNMYPGAWVIANGGRKARNAAWGVTPQAQNTGTSTLFDMPKRNPGLE